jgi:hypothetical protein
MNAHPLYIQGMKDALKLWESQHVGSHANFENNLPDLKAVEAQNVSNMLPSGIIQG